MKGHHNVHEKFIFMYMWCTCRFHISLLNLSYGIGSESDITPWITIDKPQVVYMFY